MNLKSKFISASIEGMPEITHYVSFGNTGSSLYQSLGLGIFEILIRFCQINSSSINTLKDFIEKNRESCLKLSKIHSRNDEVIYFFQIYEYLISREHSAIMKFEWLNNNLETSEKFCENLDFGMRALICCLNLTQTNQHLNIFAGNGVSNMTVTFNLLCDCLGLKVILKNQANQAKVYCKTESGTYPIINLYDNSGHFILLYTKEMVEIEQKSDFDYQKLNSDTFLHRSIIPLFKYNGINKNAIDRPDKNAYPFPNSFQKPNEYKNPVPINDNLNNFKQNPNLYQSAQVANDKQLTRNYYETVPNNSEQVHYGYDTIPVKRQESPSNGDPKPNKFSIPPPLVSVNCSQSKNSGSIPMISNLPQNDLKKSAIPAKNDPIPINIIGNIPPSIKHENSPKLSLIPPPVYTSQKTLPSTPVGLDSINQKNTALGYNTDSKENNLHKIPPPLMPNQGRSEVRPSLPKHGVSPENKNGNGHFQANEKRISNELSQLLDLMSEIIIGAQLTSSRLKEYANKVINQHPELNSPECNIYKLTLGLMNPDHYSNTNKATMKNDDLGKFAYLSGNPVGEINDIKELCDNCKKLCGKELFAINCGGECMICSNCRIQFDEDICPGCKRHYSDFENQLIMIMRESFN